MSQASVVRRFSIKGFKGIGDEGVTIDVKPIMLLFGANSAGKSTVLHALHYAREIFEQHNLDADRTAAGGEFVDLGGFKSFVHGHDLSKPVVLSFDLDLGDVYLPVRVRISEYFDEEFSNSFEPKDISPEVHTASVEATVNWCFSRERPQVSRYSVRINELPLATIDCQISGSSDRSIAINYMHPIIGQSIIDLFSESKHFFDAVFGGAGAEVKSPLVTLANSAREPYPDALPKWGTCLNVHLDTTGIKVPEDDSLELSLNALISTLSQLLVEPGQLIRDWLKDFRYLGPLRKVPERNHQPPRYPDPGRWASGLAAWDTMVADPDICEAANNWLARPECLNSGIRIENRRYGELTPENTLRLMELITSHASLDEIDRVLGVLSNGQRLVIHDIAAQIELEPHDVGTGITQLVPVVVAGVDGGASLTMIAEPELHLHPALQVRLAELFIDRAHKGLGPVLLETHSEHLLLRLLRRIRETNDGELPANHPGLSPDTLSVVYVERHERQVVAYPVHIDGTGEFSDQWPKGFFDERAKELF